jgi:hypothetical protein
VVLQMAGLTYCFIIKIVERVLICDSFLLVGN